MVVNEFSAKQNFCHLHRVFGALGCSNRTHERLITVTHVGINHVEMPFIYRQINRLTNGSSGMVKLRTEVGEFDKITEVLNRRVASPFLYISDEGRAVSRNQNQVLTADDYISFRISGMLNEFLGSSIANQALAHSFGESHPFLLHIRTCIL